MSISSVFSFGNSSLKSSAIARDIAERTRKKEREKKGERREKNREYERIREKKREEERKREKRERKESPCIAMVRKKEKK